MRVSVLSRRLALALVLAAACLSGGTACAQTAPVSYWIPGSPFGFGGSLDGGQRFSTYGDFPRFDGSGASVSRINFPNGWFVGGEGGRAGLGLNGFGSAGNFGALDYQGVQLGYKFQNAASGPITMFAGFDTVKFSPNVGGGPFAAFDSPNAQSGYSARAGIEFKPASNLSLSLGVGFTQQPSTRLDNDITNLTASPFSGRR
jgi:opacity protein-like surface antigen